MPTFFLCQATLMLTYLHYTVTLGNTSANGDVESRDKYNLDVLAMAMGGITLAS
jgi:hypothetical protein